MNQSSWLLTGAAALAVIGCGGSKDLEVPSGSTRLRVVETPFALEMLAEQGQIRLRTTPAPIRVGRLSDQNPSEFVDPAEPPAAVEWGELDTLSSAERQGEALVLTLTGTAGTGRLTIAPGPADTFSLDLAIDRPERVVLLESRWAVDLAEDFYGLGEYFDTPRHTGLRRRLALLVDTTIESGYNEVHAPVPFLVSTGGWGVYVEDARVGVFDVAASEPGVVGFTFAAQALRFHLVAGSDPLQAVARYTDLSGRPALPEPWTFAPMQWRNELSVDCTVDCAAGCQPTSTGRDKALEDARAMRQHDIPGSCIWLDAPWMRVYTNFEYNPVQFPDAASMVTELHALGYRVLAHVAPFINNTDDAGDQCGVATGRDPLGLYAEGVANGYFVLQDSGSPWVFPWRSGAGSLVDFTDPEAMAWWQELVRTGVRAGIEGFKCDWDEYVVPYLDVAGTKLVNPYRFADGSDQTTMHALYEMYFHRSLREVLDQEGFGGFILSRAGAAGDQRYTTAIWPGDLDSDFSRYRATDEGLGTACTSDTDCALGLICSGDKCKHRVGGLPSALMAAQSLSASGYPFFASDTGGFRHGAPTSETLLRWAALSALGPHMQLGGGGPSHNPWDFSISDFDADTLSGYRSLARLHTDLFPMFYALSREACEVGVPVLRPLGLAFPDDPQAAAAIDQFMVGSWLLAAPVIEAGADRRSVYLPAGRWLGYFDHQVLQGPTTVELEAPLGSVPLLLLEGAVVALGHPEIDTLAPASDPEVVDLDDRADWLGLRLVPSDRVAGRFQLADGTEIELTGGAFVEVALHGASLERTVRLEIDLALSGLAAPQTSSLDGASLTQRADEAALESAGSGWVLDGNRVIALVRGTDFSLQLR